MESEQELEEAEFEEDSEETEEQNEIGERELTIEKIKDIYLSSEFIKRLGELYEIYGTWAATAKNLSLEYKIDIPPTKVRELYFKNLAKTTSNEETRKIFEGELEKLSGRWNKAWEMVGDLINMYEKLKDNILQHPEGEQAIMLLKLTPQILSITSEIRKQLEFIRKQQEEIKVNQKNFIFNNVQINQTMHEILGKWVREGYIKILKNPIKEKEVKNGERKKTD